MNKEFKLPEGFEDAKVVEETPVEQERTFEGDMKFCFSYIDNVMQLPEKPTRAPGKDGQPGEMLDPTPKRAERVYPSARWGYPGEPPPCAGDS